MTPIGQGESHFPPIARKKRAENMGKKKIRKYSLVFAQAKDERKTSKKSDFLFTFPNCTSYTQVMREFYMTFY